MSKRKETKLKRQVLKELTDLGAWEYYHAQTGSAYVKVSDPRIGSLHIADHGGRKKYSYRWNLEVNGKTRVENDKGVKRRYYNHTDIQDLFSRLRLYKKTIDHNDKERGYCAVKDYNMGHRLDRKTKEVIA